MRDFMVLCLHILSGIVDCWFGLDIGTYSFGSFLTAAMIISVLVSSLVVVFRRRPSRSDFDV